MVSRNGLSLVVKNDGLVDMTPKAAPTGSYSHILRVNKYDYTPQEYDCETKYAKYALAITRTIQYLGWMSLKNDDHNGTAKAVKEAVATRKAADSLLASGSIRLLGTWSNGIAVGPGTGFVACTNEPEVIAPVKAKKSAPRTRKPAKSAMQIVAEESKPWVSGNVPPAPAMHGPAFVAKPRVRVPLATMQACSPRWMPASNPPGHMLSAFHAKCNNGTLAAEWRCINNRAARKAERPAQPATVAPTPIYTPSVGDTIAITYQHERMTTDRIVNVQRVAADGKTFRGYDRTYDRVRNYEMARVLTIRRIGGEGVDIAAG